MFAPGDNTCNASVFSELVVVNDNGVYSTVGSHNANLVGTYRWTAVYGGDGGNHPASSGCQDELVQISAAPPPPSPDPFTVTRIASSSVVPIATGTIGTAIADCDPDEWLVGGGYSFIPGITANFLLLMSGPETPGSGLGNAWKAQILNLADLGNLTAFAICTK